MKNLFALLSFFVLPFIAFGDVLPEPNILTDDEEILIIENNDNLENITETIDYAEYEKEGEFIQDEETEEETEEESEEYFDNNGFTDGGMGMIAYGFCNEGLENITDSLNAAITQQEPFTVCFLLENYADIDLSIQASLVSTVPDDQGGSACGLSEDFQNFMSSGDLGIINIPANNYVIKEFDITFPLGYDGEQEGCLVYNMYKGDDEGEGIGLKVVMRRGLHMKFFVGALDGIKNEFTINDLTTKFDDNNDLIMSFWVENTGNMENTFNIEGTVKGLFGYNKKFEATDGQLAPGKSQFVEINLGSLPSYGGKYNIDFTINGTPYFSYDISNANVDPARLEPKSWEFSTSVFKMPWLILAVVVVFILLLIVLFRKPKQKVVYVQQQPTQPVQQPTQQYTQPMQQPVQPVQQPQQPQNPNYPQN